MLVACLLVVPKFSHAQEAPAPPPPGGAGASDKAYVTQYFVVVAVIGLGLTAVCRSGKRAPEIPAEREVRSATKEGANV